MAIKISGSTIIDDSRNIINAGVVTASKFSGSGENLTNLNLLEPDFVSRSTTALQIGGVDGYEATKFIGTPPGITTDTADQHGYSVAVSKDSNYMIAGSPGHVVVNSSNPYGIPADTYKGISVVYKRQSGTYSYETIGILTGSVGNTVDSDSGHIFDSQSYGANVATNDDGTIFLVSDIKGDTPETLTDVGVVYVYEREGTTISQVGILTIPSIDQHYFDGGVDVGSGYTGGESPPGFTTSLQKTKHQNSLFGSAIGISSDGSRIVIGAPQATNNGIFDFAVGAEIYTYSDFDDLGAVYIYDRNGSNYEWSGLIGLSSAIGDYRTVDHHRQAFTFTDINFGISLVLSPDGNTLIAGHPSSYNGQGTICTYDLQGITTATYIRPTGIVSFVDSNYGDQVDNLLYSNQYFGSQIVASEDLSRIYVGAQDVNHIYDSSNNIGMVGLINYAPTTGAMDFVGVTTLLDAGSSTSSWHRRMTTNSDGSILVTGGRDTERRAIRNVLENPSQDSGRGAVFTFIREDDSLRLSGVTTESGAGPVPEQTMNRFGSDVSLDGSGEILVIGADSYTVPGVSFGENRSGALFVARENAKTVLYSDGATKSIGIGEPPKSGYKLSVDGKVTANSFAGDGSRLTGITTSLTKHSTTSGTSYALGRPFSYKPDQTNSLTFDPNWGTGGSDPDVTLYGVIAAEQIDNEIDAVNANPAPQLDGHDIAINSDGSLLIKSGSLAVDPSTSGNNSTSWLPRRVTAHRKLPNGTYEQVGFVTAGSLPQSFIDGYGTELDDAFGSNVSCNSQGTYFSVTIGDSEVLATTYSNTGIATHAVAIYKIAGDDTITHVGILTGLDPVFFGTDGSYFGRSVVFNADASRFYIGESNITSEFASIDKPFLSGAGSTSLAAPDGQPGYEGFSKVGRNGLVHVYDMDSNDNITSVGIVTFKYRQNEPISAISPYERRVKHDFGWSIALSGDEQHLYVGAPSYNPTENTPFTSLGPGGVAHYNISGVGNTIFTQTGINTSTSLTIQTNTYFGWDIATNYEGNKLYVSHLTATKFDNESSSIPNFDLGSGGRGLVYAFDRSGNDISLVGIFSGTEYRDDPTDLGNGANYYGYAIDTTSDGNVIAITAITNIQGYSVYQRYGNDFENVYVRSEENSFTESGWDDAAGTNSLNFYAKDIKLTDSGDSLFVKPNWTYYHGVLLDNRTTEKVVTVDSGGNVDISGKVTADSFAGDGSRLTNVSAATADHVSNATYAQSIGGFYGYETIEKLVGVRAGSAEKYGQEVAISGDGNVIAISALKGEQLDPDSATGAGEVVVMKRVGGTDAFSTIGIITAGEYYNSTDGFAESLALDYDGSTLIIGAPYQHIPGLQPYANSDMTKMGLAYVYDRNLSNNTLSLVGILTAGAVNSSLDMYPSSFSGVGTDANFGYHVGVNSDGTRYAVGAPNEYHNIYYSGVNGGNADEAEEQFGAVHIFDRSGSTLTETKRITNQLDGEQLSDDNFGISFKMTSDGNLIYIGAPGAHGFNLTPSGGSGAVLTYDISQTGIANTIGITTIPNTLSTNPTDRFGFSVDCSNDGSILVVGDPQSTGTGGRPGRAFVYEKDNNNNITNIGIITDLKSDPLSGFQNLNDPNDITILESSTEFGFKVQCNFDASVISIGDPSSEMGSNVTGIVGIYNREGSNIKLVDVVLPDELGYPIHTTAPRDFGHSLAMSDSGKYLLIGAPLDSVAQAGGGPTGGISLGSWWHGSVALTKNQLKSVLTSDTVTGVLIPGNVNTSNNISIGATVLPYNGSTFDLGSDVKTWNNIYSNNVGIGTTVTSALSVNGDIETVFNGQGLILISPNGTRYRLSVDNSGNISASSV